MSDSFETALNELYTRASAAHADAGGFPTGALVVTARRRRRARTTAVAVTTAAAVVGIGLGGAQAVRLLDDGRAAPPAVTTSPAPTPTTSPVTGSVLEPECGTALADLALIEDSPWRLELTLDDDEVVAGAAVQASYSLVTELGVVTEETPRTTYLVVRDGVVVGFGTPVGRAASAPEPGRFPVLLNPRACAADGTRGGAPLAPGGYDVHLVARLALELPGGPVPGLVLSEPVPLTVVADDEGSGDDPEQAPQSRPYQPVDPAGLVHEVSASFVDGSPLADDDYVGILHGIDPVAGTVDVDLVTFYRGAAADDYVAEHLGWDYAYNDIHVVNESERVTTLPLAPDALVAEACFEGDGSGTERYLTRTVAQWAAAPSQDQTVDFSCSRGEQLAQGRHYWLRVRDGVVVQVTGQYAP